MKIGVIGTGRIADIVVKTFDAFPQLESYAVAARDPDRAKAFAGKHGFTKYYGSYEELVCDEQVQLVYIATPHSLHAEHMRLCIEHGKAVICEKSFTVNQKEAMEIAELSRERGVFVSEAIWTRYMPSRRLIRELIDSGIVGNVHAMCANLWYPVQDKERIIRPELGGGALLDVGVYGLNAACMAFGNDIVKLKADAKLSPLGVDDMLSVNLHYADGRMAMISAGTVARSDRGGVFYGESGYITVDNINNPKRIAAYSTADVLLKELIVPAQTTGYEYEFLEAVEAIERGEISPQSMPMEETLFIMGLMDEIRGQISE